MPSRNARQLKSQLEIFSTGMVIFSGIEDFLIYLANYQITFLREQSKQN